jgi:2-polyprenyl-3-methyl-5-hydroxy-6-metoxy-1,4-benzoquinol methylase
MSLRERKRAKEVEADEVAFFDRYYANEAYNPIGWRLRLNRELRALQRVSKRARPQNVLSVGCGDGQFELMLAPFVDRILAIDISLQAIERAKRNATLSHITNVEFRCQSMSELRWDQQFDAIICLAFLHHILEPDLVDFLKRVYAHTKVGGFFYSQDPNIHGVLRAIGKVLLGAKYDYYHSPDERELDPQDLAEKLRGVGFDTVTIRHIDFTLIPAQYVLAKRPGWPLYLCPSIDWILCHSPLARWSSGFTAFAEKWH